MYKFKCAGKVFSAGLVNKSILLICSVVLLACGGGEGDVQTSAADASSNVTPSDAQDLLPELDRSPNLAGADDDNDGVRDDIGEYLRRTYTDPLQLRSAMQMARAYQQTLLVDLQDAVSLNQVSEGTSRAIVCAIDAFPREEGRVARSKMRTDIRDMTMNTKNRLLAYLAYSKALSGSVSVRPEGNTCD